MLASEEDVKVRSIAVLPLVALCRFFTKKVGYMPEEDPTLPYIKPTFKASVADIDEALDVDLAASGVDIVWI